MYREVVIGDRYDVSRLWERYVDVVGRDCENYTIGSVYKISLRELKRI